MPTNWHVSLSRSRRGTCVEPLYQPAWPPEVFLKPKWSWGNWARETQASRLERERERGQDAYLERHRMPMSLATESIFGPYGAVSKGNEKHAQNAPPRDNVFLKLKASTKQSTALRGLLPSPRTEVLGTVY